MLTHPVLVLSQGERGGGRKADSLDRGDDSEFSHHFRRLGRSLRRRQQGRSISVTSAPTDRDSSQYEKERSLIRIVALHNRGIDQRCQDPRRRPVQVLSLLDCAVHLFTVVDPRHGTGTLIYARYF